MYTVALTVSDQSANASQPSGINPVKKTHVLKKGLDLLIVIALEI